MNYSNLAAGQGYSNGMWDFLQRQQHNAMNGAVSGANYVYNNWSYTEAFTGWSMAYNFTNMTREATEVSQGGNYLLAATSRIVQVVAVIGAMQTLLYKADIPRKTLLSVTCVFVALGSIPLALLVAVVKTGEYEKYRPMAHEVLHKHFPNHFSKEGTPLTPAMKSTCEFLADNWETITRVSMVAIAVGLFAAGNVSFAAMSLAHVSYEVADKNNYVPRKISIFIERYMPVVATIGTLIGNPDLISRIAYTVQLISQILDVFTKTCLQKVDTYARAYFKLNLATPTLEQFDAPLEEKPNLTYAEITTLLFKSPTDFEINPAHCSKPVVDYTEQLQDTDYNKFLKLFDNMKFQEKYNLVGPKLKDDDRFMLFLVKETGKERKEVFDNFLQCITELATKAGKTKEQYVANYAREQLVTLTGLLKGEARVEGSQEEFDHCIPRYAIINHYLSQQALSENEKEDFVLRLAVECGAYCGTGQDDRSAQLLHDVLHSASGIVEQDNDNAVIKDFEQKVRVALYQERQFLVQEQYQKWMGANLLGNKEAPTDVHLALRYQASMGIGFVPQSDFYQRKISIYEMYINTTKLTGLFRDPMYKKYSDFSRYFPSKGSVSYGVIHDAITHKVGDDQFVDYIRRSYHGNEKLSDHEKEILDEMLAGGAKDSAWSQLSAAGQMVCFHNLMLYQMGIIRLKQDH